MDIENASLAAGNGFFEKFGHALIAVSQRFQEHRQVDAGNGFDTFGRNDFAHSVARCRAIHIGQDQHALALLKFGQFGMGAAQHVGGVVAGGKVEVFECFRALAEYMGRALNQAFTKVAVRDDK